MLSTDYREAGLVSHELGHAFSAQHLEDTAPDEFPMLCPDVDCQADTCGDPNPAGGPVMCGHIQQPTTGFYHVTLDDIADFVATTSCMTPIQTSAVTPWQSNANGTQSVNIGWNYALGYHFTPQVNGTVTELGGLFNGTKVVRLFNKATGALLAQANVTSANNWAYTPINGVSVQAGTTYTVAAYLAGSGGSYRSGVNSFPQVYGPIRIEGTTWAHTGAYPDARPTNTYALAMYGQADIKFVPSP